MALARPPPPTPTPTPARSAERGVSGGPQGAKRGEEGGAREEHFVVTNASQNATETLVFVLRKRAPPPSGVIKRSPLHTRAGTHTHTHTHAGPAGPDVWARAAS